VKRDFGSDWADGYEAGFVAGKAAGLKEIKPGPLTRGIRSWQGTLE
jgi:hypothetical protein